MSPKAGLLRDPIEAAEMLAKTKLRTAILILILAALLGAGLWLLRDYRRWGEAAPVFIVSGVVIPAILLVALHRLLKVVRKMKNENLQDED